MHETENVCVSSLLESVIVCVCAYVCLYEQTGVLYTCCGQKISYINRIDWCNYRSKYMFAHVYKCVSQHGDVFMHPCGLRRETCLHMYTSVLASMGTCSCTLVA